MEVTLTEEVAKVVVIKLSEAEAREALHTPDALQKQIRGSLNADRATRKHGKGWTDDAFPKAKAAGVGRGKQIRVSRPCQFCGKPIKNSIHEQKCPQNPARAAK